MLSEVLDTEGLLCYLLQSKIINNLIATNKLQHFHIIGLVLGR